MSVIDFDQIGQGIVASIVTVGAVISWLTARRAKAKVQEIHVLVNSQKTVLEQRIIALEAKLDLRAGEKIPAQQIVTPTTEAEDAK